MVQYSNNPNLHDNPSANIVFLIFDLLYAALPLQSDPQIYNQEVNPRDPPQFAD